MRIKTRTYYTLEDMILDLFTGWDVRLDLGQPFSFNADTFFLTVIKDLYAPTVITTDTVIGGDVANTLFCKYIAPRNKQMFVTYIDGAVTDDEIKAGYKDFIRKYIFILNSTYDRYSKLIELYAAEKNNLMADVKSYSESKFNDTPQNVQGTFSFDTDDHLTNVTRNEVSNEIATKMARINEIDELMKNVYLDWANQFNKLFLY